MITVDTRGGAIALLIVALILLGTWGSLLNYAERRGRHTVHTQMDFVIGFVVVPIVCALTLGQLGPETYGENFFKQLTLAHENRTLIGFAMASGFCIYFGNLAEQYALALAGVTVSVPIFSSCIVILGTVLNYFLDSGLNRATLLFPGVACFACAVIAGSLTHVFNEEHLRKRKHAFDASVGAHKVGTALIGFEHASKNPESAAENGAAGLHNDTAHNGNLSKAPKRAVTAAGPGAAAAGSSHGRLDMADADSSARSVRTTSAQRVYYGIGVSIIGGLVGALFSPGFNVTTNDSFHTLPPGVKPLTVYTGYFWFCVMYAFLGVLVTALMMRFPPLGQPCTTWIAWAKDRTWLSFVGFMAGVLVSVANVLQFLGGEAAGYAASDLVQANPLVATLWGLLFFKEYRRSSMKAYTCLSLMYCFFIAAVALLAASAQQRPGQ